MSEIDPTEHLGLVHSIVAKMAWRDRGALGRDDLLQAGMIGLIRAARGYNNGIAAFSTYAYPCILSEIRDEMRRSSNTVRVPRKTKSGSSQPLVRASGIELLRMSTSDQPDVVDLRRDVGRLKQPMRGVLEDYYFNDRTMREIAALRGCTHQNVDFIRRRGLEQLRRKMGIDSPPKKRLASRSPLRIHSLTAGAAMCAS
jgi:RNA polymerase sigma factor (sigma-70 family)